MYLEGRSWMSKILEEFNVKIVGKLQKNKFYLHQLFTTAFVEFDTLQEVKDCIAWLNAHDFYWDYDPVAVLDTSKEGTLEQWQDFMI